MSSNFVFDKPALPTPKSDGAIKPSVAATKQIKAADINGINTSLDDVRNAITSGQYHGLVSNPAAPQSSAGNAVAHQNGATVQHSVNGGRFQTVSRQESRIWSVLDYGADPTGYKNGIFDPTSDSTAAIQAAIDAALAATKMGSKSIGPIIYLPAGVYNVSSTLRLCGSTPTGSLGLTFRGDHHGATIIKWMGIGAHKRYLPGVAFASSEIATLYGRLYTASATGVAGGSLFNSLALTDTISAWATSQANSVGFIRSNGGNSYVCTYAGTTASTGAGPSGTGTNILDGSCYWNYAGPGGTIVWTDAGPDYASDMVLARDYSQLTIENIEFTSATGLQVNSYTTTPVCIIRSQSDGSNQVSPSGLIIRNVLVNWTQSNTGLLNQQDYGIMWTCPDGFNAGNNSEGYVTNFGINGSKYAAIYITGSQAQDMEFYRLVIQGSNQYGIQTGNGGSFSVRDSNVNCAHGTGVCFVIGAPNDRILIDHCICEDAGRLLSVGAVGAFAAPTLGGSPFPIAIRNCRWSANQMQNTPPWAVSTTYAPGTIVVNTNNGNSYTCTTPGTSAATGTGPSGTGTGITDGTAVWAYKQVGGDGRFIVYGYRGPFIFENNFIDGGTACVIPSISLPTSSGSFRSRISDNAFTYHWDTGPTPFTPTEQSIVPGQGFGCVETGNMYFNYKLSASGTGNGNDSFMRAEAGSLTLKAPPAWATSTFYALGATVTAGGALYLQSKFGGGTSAAAGSGPTGQENINDWILDGTCHWVRASDPTSAVIDGSQQYHRFEIPMGYTAYSLNVTPTVRTGASVASTVVQSITKYTHGFTVNLSAAPTGTDSITFDWSMKQP